MVWAISCGIMTVLSAASVKPTITIWISTQSFKAANRRKNRGFLRKKAR
jgi:hypothetical protein